MTAYDAIRKIVVARFKRITPATEAELDPVSLRSRSKPSSSKATRNTRSYTSSVGLTRTILALRFR
jgi:hypothetical protein